ncbi:MAG TPA: protein translocase subunit SecD, partial [Blastocatellia bacterium]|nr:protein translocase subunit SecD [Blastocatellia bacterium]
HLVMQVQTDEVITKLTERNAESASTKLKQKNIPFTEAKATGPGTVVVSVPDPSKNADIVRELENDFGQGWTASDKGSTVVATLDDTTSNQLRDRATEQAKQIIENRVNAFGVAEPLVARQGGEGTYQILIQMPGVDDPERVKNTLNADSNLEIRLQAQGTSTYPTREAAEGAAKTLPGGPGQYEVFPYRERTADGGAAPESFVVLEKSVVITGLDMRDASARLSATGGSSYEISFSLTPNGATRFADVTGRHVNDFLAIVLNNEVKSIARINQQIHDQGQITGSFTKRQSEDLALILRSGALPAKAVYLEERTVGPSLGADSIRQGVTASIAGLLAVVLFMLFYYRGSGVNAVLALILNLILLLAALVMFGATLTLPGIAGVILTIGMAVDSNVLIFERIREELRNGKVVASAVDVGFNKAFLTIIDTHVTTIVSAIFLFVFGTGPIRGFAVTLVAGLLANLFTAVFVSRTIFMWHLNRKARVETLSI